MWITGTATGLKNLLSLLKDHLEDEGWTINSYGTDGAAPRTDYLYARAPGFGTGYENYCQIRTFENAPSNHYCLEAAAATGYDATKDFMGQPGSVPARVYMRLWDASMEYWLSVNDRRFVLIVKCSNTYHSLHAGFFNAFATPVEYPYPYYLASDSDSAGPFGATENETRCIAFPGDGAAYLREPGGLWRTVAVYNDSGTSGGGTLGFQINETGSYTVYPYNIPGGADSVSSQLYFGPYAQFENLPGTSDTLFLQNCYLTGLENNGGVIGALEGVYWTPGNTASAEQEITVDSDTYRTFIAISRSVESPNQFYAVKEV